MDHLRNLALVLIGLWAVLAGSTQLRLFDMPPALLGGISVVGGALLIVSVFGGEEPPRGKTPG